MAARKKSAKKVKRMSPTKSPSMMKRKSGAKSVSKRPHAKASKSHASKSKISVGHAPFTKSEFIQTLMTETELSKKEVVLVLDSITNIIAAHLHKQGPEVFSWPGLLKMKVVRKPATKARQGISPFTGEPMVFKAKPASRRVKILPLKHLKDIAAS